MCIIAKNITFFPPPNKINIIVLDLWRAFNVCIDDVIEIIREKKNDFTSSAKNNTYKQIENIFDYT